MGNASEELENQKNQDDQTAALTEECRMITRYLLGQEPPQQLIQRYLQANLILFSGQASDLDLAVLNFTRRNPWMLPHLDAVLSILHPDSLLRNKILLMIAILEASPQFVEVFTPENFSVGQFLWRTTGCGISSMVKFLIGICIYPFAVNAR